MRPRGYASDGDGPVDLDEAGVVAVPPSLTDAGVATLAAAVRSWAPFRGPKWGLAGKIRGTGPVPTRIRNRRLPFSPESTTRAARLLYRITAAGIFFLNRD